MAANGGVSGLQGRMKVAAVVTVLLVLGFLGQWARTHVGTTLPRQMPYAQALSAEQLEAAKAQYVRSLRTSAERDAFKRGYVGLRSKIATWGIHSENLNESGYPHAAGYNRRQTEAYSMGAHLALQEGLKAEETGAAGKKPGPGPRAPEDQ